MTTDITELTTEQLTERIFALTLQAIRALDRGDDDASKRLRDEAEAVWRELEIRKQVRAAFPSSRHLK
jgi:hypothetical protein